MIIFCYKSALTRTHTHARRGWRRQRAISSRHKSNNNAGRGCFFDSVFYFYFLPTPHNRNNNHSTRGPPYTHVYIRIVHVHIVVTPLQEIHYTTLSCGYGLRRRCCRSSLYKRCVPYVRTRRVHINIMYFSVRLRTKNTNTLEGTTARVIVDLYVVGIHCARGSLEHLKTAKKCAGRGKQKVREE